MSLRLVAMVAEFLDDNKPIKSLKNYSHYFKLYTDLFQFHLIWQILAKFSLGPYLSLSSLKKESDNFVLCSPTP